MNTKYTITNIHCNTDSNNINNNSPHFLYHLEIPIVIFQTFFQSGITLYYRGIKKGVSQNGLKLGTNKSANYIPRIFRPS